MYNYGIEQKQNSHLFGGLLLVALLVSALITTGLTSNASNLQTHQVNLVSAKKTTQKTKKEKSKKKLRKFAINEKNCALLQRWIDKGIYTQQVKKRNLPYLGDFNGRKGHILQIKCVKAGYDVFFP